MTNQQAEHWIRAIVAERLGIRWADFHEALMPELIAKLRVASVGSVGVDTAEHREVSAHELRELAREVTVGETYFFREVAQLEALAAVVVPELLRNHGRRPIRILSAGCSSGEEAYSIVIALQEHFGPAAAGQISVTGIDVNPTAITKARQASYSPWALRATPQPIRERYFRKEGKDYCLNEEIRASVRFEERNLLGDDGFFWNPRSFDVIFCRNVIIYFSAESIRTVVARFADALVPGGVLFMGHSETLDQVSTDFERQYVHGAFCYVRKAVMGVTTLGNRNTRPENTKLPNDSPNDSIDAGTPDWFTKIADATDRVQRLLEQKDKPRGSIPKETSASPATVVSAAQPMTGGFGEALRLFHDEQFDEALSALRRSKLDGASATRAKLLQALILCSRGAVPAAKTICIEILGSEPQNAEAHHALAIACKYEGNADAAIQHDYDAILADPTFALAYLQLGMSLRRTGNWGAASSTLSRALALMDREMDERILLFGEGFRREALLFLCRAEIHNLGRGV